MKRGWKSQNIFLPPTFFTVEEFREAYRAGFLTHGSSYSLRLPDPLASGIVRDFVPVHSGASVPDSLPFLLW
jgi:hypothetical protein